MENESTPASSESKKSMSPMVILGIVVIVLILAGAAYFMTKKGTNAPSTSSASNQVPTVEPTTSVPESGSPAPSGTTKQEGAVKSLEVDGSNFKFTPNTLSVNEGDMVKITFKNTQGFHDFYIDEFNVKSKTIPANSTDEITFKATKKGSFQFYCSVGNHRAMGMVGTLTVN